MQMTDGEIMRNYNQAKDKKTQISILADLNCCTKEKIEQIVGLMEKPKDVKVLDKLYAQLEEIDEQIKSFTNQIKDLEEEYKKINIAIEVLGKVDV